MNVWLTRGCGHYYCYNTGATVNTGKERTAYDNGKYSTSYQKNGQHRYCIMRWEEWSAWFIGYYHFRSARKQLLEDYCVLYDNGECVSKHELLYGRQRKEESVPLFNPKALVNDKYMSWARGLNSKRNYLRATETYFEDLMQSYKLPSTMDSPSVWDAYVNVAICLGNPSDKPNVPIYSLPDGLWITSPTVIQGYSNGQMVECYQLSPYTDKVVKSVYFQNQWYTAEVLLEDVDCVHMEVPQGLEPFGKYMRKLCDDRYVSYWTIGLLHKLLAYNRYNMLERCMKAVNSEDFCDNLYLAKDGDLFEDIFGTSLNKLNTKGTTLYQMLNVTPHQYDVLTRNIGCVETPSGIMRDIVKKLGITFIELGNEHFDRMFQTLKDIDALDKKANENTQFHTEQKCPPILPKMHQIIMDFLFDASIKTIENVLQFTKYYLLDYCERVSVSVYYSSTCRAYQRDYVDYMRMRSLLEDSTLPVKFKATKYPLETLLKSKHNELISRVNDYKYVLRDKEIEQAGTSAEKKFGYSGENYCIIAPKSAEEIRREGKQQHNCVASYTRDVAEGKTYILFMRRKSELDKSYITIEVSPTGGLRQCYEAFNHTVSDKSARDFLKEWKMKKSIR